MIWSMPTCAGGVCSCAVIRYSPGFDFSDIELRKYTLNVATYFQIVLLSVLSRDMCAEMKAGVKSVLEPETKNDDSLSSLLFSPSCLSSCTSSDIGCCNAPRLVARCTPPASGPCTADVCHTYPLDHRRRAMKLKSRCIVCTHVHKSLLDV